MVQSYRLAPQQRRCWVLYSGAPPRACAAIPIPMPLDVRRLWSAVDIVSARHDVFRTVFTLQQGHRVPLMEVAPSMRIERNEAQPSYWETLTKTLSTEPAGFRLVNLGFDQHELWIDAPAALVDAWSFALLARELAAEYHGQPSPDAPVQYPQFALWQNGLCDEAGFELPSMQRTVTRGAALGWQPVRVRDLPDPENWLAALWHVLLARRNEGVDLTVGHVRQLRPYDELRTCVGLLACVVPFKTVMDEQSRFDEVIAAACRSFRKTPTQTRAPIGKADYLQYGMRFVTVSDTGWQLSRVRDHVDRFDVQLSVIWGSAGPIEVGLQFDEERLDRSAAAHLAEEFEVLVEAAFQDHHRPVTTMPILGPKERQKMFELSGGGTCRECHTCLHDVISAVGRLHRDSIAVEDDTTQMSYGALDAWSDQLALSIREHGVSGEMQVGICLEPSVSVVAAILAVWKAGAAYVPLDPRLPRQRLREFVDLADVEIVLCDQMTFARTPQVASVVRIDEICHGVSPVNRVGRSYTDSAAYVLFTSGSSGQPKPVVVEHRQIASYIEAAISRFGLKRGERYALVSTLSADLGFTVLFGSLASGGRLRMIPWMRTFDPQGLSRDLATRPVDVLKIVPSHLQCLLDGSAQPHRLIPRRCLILGGEPAKTALIDYVRDLAPGCEIWNHYGPTEATVGSVCGPIEALDSDFPPLGRPLDGQQVFVLDDSSAPVPAGVPGELFIGGSGVSRGYLKSPSLTAERFVPDPFGTRGGRLYRTGDRARWLSDGRLAFIGRIDEQVKIRGHRVELGEIAAALRAQPGISDVAVRAVECASGERRLVAYVVPDLNYHAVRMASLSDDTVVGWTSVFDDTYERLEFGPEAQFQPNGWNSSYTGRPIPIEEVREHLDATVNRIRSFSPRRVLEVGCGQGLLLFPLAGAVESYVGTDVSLPALKFNRAVLDFMGDVSNRVELRHQAANDTSGLSQHAFDMVVLNSVVQYFPSVDYVLAVMAKLLPLVREGGRFFIGDVRNLRLLEAFHAGVQVQRASPRTSSVQIADWSARQRTRDGELLLDPDFFIALLDSLLGIADVEVQLKTGRYHNELTCFRYDVILHVGKDRIAPQSLSWSDWTADWDLARLESCLSNGIGHLALTGIPNARVIRDVHLAQSLRKAGLPTTVERLVESVGDVAEGSVDPARIDSLASRYGYHCRLSWAPPGQEDAFEAVLSRNPIGSVVPSVPPRGCVLIQCANAPLLDKLGERLVPQLELALRQKLPDFMCPSSLLLVPGLPITPNGKVDLSALPVPPRRHYPVGQHRVPPRTRTEERVAEIFAEVLQVEGFGIRDDFFDLGGHSLSATQTVARLSQMFGVDLRLRSFFEGAATVERIAGLLSTQPSPPPVIPLRQGKHSKAPLSRAQERYLLEGDPAHPVYNIPFAFYLSGELDVTALQRSLDEIVRRHSLWRSVFDFGGTHHCQRVVEDIGFRLNERDLAPLAADAQSREVRRIAGEEALRRFDLASEPAVRGTLMRLNERLHALSLVVHHLVSDGWSTGIFCQELSVLYSAFRERRPSPLPELSVQYSDYAHWQRNWLRGDILARQMDYWTRRLRCRNLSLALPIERSRPQVQTWRGTGIDVSLPSNLTGSARQVARDQNVPIFVVLLSAFKCLLFAAAGGQTDIGVGTPVANRTRVEFEPLLGCFINFLVLQTELSGDPTFLEVLRRVRTTCVEAYENQDAPFQILVKKLLPERDRSRPPLFQVMFELANQPGSRQLLLPDISLSSLEFEHETSEFEINLILQESAPSPERALTYTGWLLYRTDLFSEASARSFFADYESILSEAIAQPKVRLSALMKALSRTWPR
jgi:amino acid adenylation domain-containing protein